MIGTIHATCRVRIKNRYVVRMLNEALERRKLLVAVRDAIREDADFRGELLRELRDALHETLLVEPIYDMQAVAALVPFNTTNAARRYLERKCPTWPRRYIFVNRIRQRVLLASEVKALRQIRHKRAGGVW